MCVTFAIEYYGMPKQQRRRTSKEAVGINTAAADVKVLRGKPAEICNELQSDTPAASDSASPCAAGVTEEARLRVPQVTITPEGCGASRELQQGDWDEEGALRRKLSNSSISSTGSSAVESEDDILSDSESKGIVTLEHLVESSEVSGSMYDPCCMAFQ